jgi:hypothetical protein
MLTLSFDAERVVHRERMRLGTLFPHGRDDIDVTECFERFRERAEANRVDTIIIREEYFHGRLPNGF